MKKYFLSFICFCVALCSFSQNIQDSNLQEDAWGWHGSLLSWRSLQSNPLGYKDGKLYIHAAPYKFEPHDSLYCYDVKKQALVSRVPNFGISAFSLDKGMKNFKIAYNSDNSRWEFKKETLTDVTLQTKSTDVLFSLDLPKNAGHSVISSVSPDSSKYAFFFTFEVEKKTYAHFYLIYNRLTDEIEKKSDLRVSSRLSFYSIYDVSVTDEGDLLLMVLSQDEKKSKKADDFYVEAMLYTNSGDVLKNGFAVPEGYKVQVMHPKALRDGKMFWVAALKSKEESVFYYSVADKKNFENVESHRYVLNDVWKEKQNVPLSRFSNLSIDYICQLDNGKIVFSGFPYIIVTICDKNGCRNNNSWGGFYVVSINPDGEFDKFNYVERYAKSLQSDTRSLQEDNLFYDMFNYGNDVYLLFNEAVKKVEANKMKAAYKQKDKKGYLLLNKIGEDGQKVINLSGSAPSTRMYNAYLGRVDNRFYVLTRNNDFGSVSYFDLPAVDAKDWTLKSSKPVKKVVVETPKVEAPVEKKQAVSRKRTVKK